MRRLSFAVSCCWLALLAGCGYPEVTRQAEDECAKEPLLSPLVINEIMSDNEGALLDNQLETEDYLELVNVSDGPVLLSEYELGHVEHKRHSLPELTLQAGERIVLFADASIGQGPTHLPLKLSSRGETLQLWKQGECRRVDTVDFPKLGENEVYARYPDATGEFESCRYASPDRDNGAACRAPRINTSLEDVSFETFDWPVPFPAVSEPLDINELVLPAAEPGFVELKNTGSEELAGDSFLLRLAHQAPGEPWPVADQGLEIPWTGSLEAGELAAIEMPRGMLEALGVTRHDDLVLNVFDRETGASLTHLDFIAFPEAAALARPSQAAPHVFCREATPGAENSCQMLESRPLGDRVRYLRTASDFDQLAAGGTRLDGSGVKVVVDLEAGGVVHLLNTADWDLHFTFARETILGEEPLDRCIPEERVLYDAGWWEYSRQNYFQQEGRRFYGATLVKHSGSAHRTLEFAVGDVISGSQMREAFFLITPHTLEPQSWSIRPQSADQIERAREVEGTLPLVGPNAPFANIEFQPLTVAVGYGVLEFVAASELGTARLGPDVIVVTDDVPNDIPLVGGLVTEAFQTPLSHVNVLSQNRGTPNMALADARDHAQVAANLGQLVRLEVRPHDFVITPATPEEANEFWEQRRPSGAPFEPRLDLDVTQLVDLETAGLDWLPAVGGKAAQFAELYRVSESVVGCGSFRVPPNAFAIPLVHAHRHAEASGARARYLEALEDENFEADYRERQRVLAEVRELVLQQPVDSELISELTQLVAERFGSNRVRLRSSSNAEDLPGFNGAGLYTSEGVSLNDSNTDLGTALKTVWASLYTQRAHDERAFANIDHRQVAMGVLVHEAYASERARGVGVSRNVLDPVSSHIHYVNAQAGEATVTNPAPGITTEQILYERLRTPPRTIYRSHSNLVAGPVLEADEVNQLSCALFFLNGHFSQLLDPQSSDPYFAIEVEFKFVGAYRDLLIKQARKHPIINNDALPECRMY